MLCEMQIGGATRSPCTIHETQNSSYCGYVFIPTDVDECTSSHSDYCDGECVNTEGSFRCTCNSDFRLDSDGRTCIPECGGHIVMANSGNITTPGWPEFYPSFSFSCMWVVETASNTIIDFSFREPFGIRGSPPCTTDYIEITDGSRDSASLGKFCSLQVPLPVHSSSNIATVVFQASNEPHASQHVGANITFIALNKGKAE